MLSLLSSSFSETFELMAAFSDYGRFSKLMPKPANNSDFVGKSLDRALEVSLFL
jgi:hypothetical protein